MSGVPTASAIGLTVEPGIGIGGTVITTGEPCSHISLDEDTGQLSAEERRFMSDAGIRVGMVVPLRSQALWSQGVRVEGLVYLGNSSGQPF